MIKRLTLWVFLLALVSGCSKAQTPTPTPTATRIPDAPVQVSTSTPLPPTETATAPVPTDTLAPEPTAAGPVAFGPQNFPTNVDPLTGSLTSDANLLERRPLSVKVQLFPRGQRPPWGISLADLVFDYYQNNGLTRLHAIFYSKDAEQVGPIRSGRLFDSQLVAMYKSVLAFGGADSRILDVFLKSDFANRLVFEGGNNCPPMCRIDPNGFNYLVTNTADLSKYVASKGIPNNRQNLAGMSFNSATPAGGQAGQQFSVRFSISAYVRWDYDASSGRYLRFQDTQEDATGGQNEAYAPLLDGLTGGQIAADNVIVLLLPHEYAYRSHSGQNEIVDILLKGVGTAYAFRDGQIFPVGWNRPTTDSVLFLTFADGTPYPFKPGVTWFEVIGQTSAIESTGPGIWRFKFGIP